MSAGGALPFQQFLATIKKATNETQKREAFIVLAATGFQDSELATDLALGAEYRVRFKSSGLLRRGAVDAFYGNLIVEFENTLSSTWDHALDQLRNYVAGAWTEDKGTSRHYLAVASDGANWHIFAPRLDDPSVGVTAENIVLEPTESWVASGSDEDAVSLRQFLDRLFFRKTLLKPTAANFARDFGLTSPSYLHAKVELERKLSELATDPQLGVYRKAWTRSLQISYGSVETDDELLAKHTYLAVLARLLVWAALERRPLTPGEMDDVLDGIYFQGRQVANLVEDDFFRWHTIPSTTDARITWVALSRHLAGYDLASIQEDVLKPLYEQLVDPATRRVLGEFYTPDWLAARLVEEILGGWNWADHGTPYVLDPACGSGTFLRTTLELARKARNQLPEPQLLDELVSRIVGIDVHPLAVVISRATYLLAIKDLLGHATRPVTLPIFLANSLSMPIVETQRSFSGEEVLLQVDDTSYPVPLDLILHGIDYDAAIEDVLTVARGYGEPTTVLSEAKNSFKALVGDRFTKYDGSHQLVETFASMAEHIAKLIRGRHNSVHGFLLKNYYRPSMLRHYFDYVVGNPPWLTVGAIATESYKKLVIDLATKFRLTRRSTGSQSNTELATVFLALAVSEFLRPSPPATRARVGLVMPRSLFTAKHHGHIREGKYNVNFDIVALWDLDRVTELFKVPACVLLASNTPPEPLATKKGVVFQGRLPQKDVPWSVAADHLSMTPTSYSLAFLGKRSAWRATSGTEVPAVPTTKVIPGHYVGRFRQGAILYPQTLLVVSSSRPPSRAAVRVHVKTDKDAIATAKKRTGLVNHLVETRNLYFTAAADHIFPFTLAGRLWTFVLPAIADPGDSQFGPVSADTLRSKGRLQAAAWLDWAEAEWRKVRKKNEKQPLSTRLDYLGHLSAQAEQKRWIVVYTAAGKRPVACVIDTKTLALPFVARDRTFWGSFATAAEAHYVAAMLNAEYAAGLIVDWMNRGLFGPRDINKRILDVAWPEFDPKDADHIAVSKASSKLATAAAALAPKLPKGTTGSLRRWLRDNLNKGDRSILNKLVQKISKRNK